jgi:integrase
MAQTRMPRTVLFIMVKKWKPLRRGDLVTRLVDGQEIWYFDDYIQFDRFSPAKRVRKSTMCLKSDYERAKEVRDDIRLKLKAGDMELRRSLTFAEWVPIWRAQYEREEEITEGTVTCHTQALRRLTAFFGHKRLDHITDGDCIEYRRWRVLQPRLSKKGPLAGTTTSANTVITECNIAKTIFKCAVRAKKLTASPWDGIALGTITPRTRVLSEDEQARVLHYADPETVRFILITLGTSFRVSALLDVPLEPIQWVTTKNGPIAMVRVVSKQKMHAQALLPIVVQSIENQTAWVKEKHPTADKLFPYTRFAIHKRLVRLAETADIPSFSAHDIRRTFGTRSDEAANALEDTAMLLNNTPAVAAKHYIQRNEGVEAVKKLRALVAMAPALLLPAVDERTGE